MTQQTVYHEPGMSKKFSVLFNEKIVKAKAKIAKLRAKITLHPPTTDPQATDSVPHMDAFANVSEAEVSKLITRLPNKSSPLDYVHTSVIKAFPDKFSKLIT